MEGEMTEDKVYTWEPITIRPNDQSLVGEVVKHESWNESEAEPLIDVGAKFIIFTGKDLWFNIDAKWLIRREMKKVRAFGWYQFSEWNLSDTPMIEEKFQRKYNSSRNLKTIFPAKMNADGTFTEPDDE